MREDLEKVFGSPDLETDEIVAWQIRPATTRNNNLTCENEAMINLTAGADRYREAKDELGEAIDALINDMEHYGQQKYDGIKIEYLRLQLSILQAL
jgi:hypothetical protein